MSVMPVGRSTITCAAADHAGNTSTTTFGVTVHRATSGGEAEVLGGHGDGRCAQPGQVAWITADGFSAGARVTIKLQASNQAVTALSAAQADRRGRVRQLVTIPAVVDGNADIVVTGPSGASDLVRMLPVHVVRFHHRYGSVVMAMLRHRDRDRSHPNPTPRLTPVPPQANFVVAVTLDATTATKFVAGGRQGQAS